MQISKSSCVWRPALVSLGPSNHEDNATAKVKRVYWSRTATSVFIHLDGEAVATHHDYVNPYLLQAYAGAYMLPHCASIHLRRLLMKTTKSF